VIAPPVGLSSGATVTLGCPRWRLHSTTLFHITWISFTRYTRRTSNMVNKIQSDKGWSAQTLQTVVNHWLHYVCRFICNSYTMRPIWPTVSKINYTDGCSVQLFQTAVNQLLHTILHCPIAGPSVSSNISNIVKMARESIT
jgi:hypothetical protein